uniref:Haloacid dehalogenase like hydrolase domain containing 5 n=1 Tax=Terrapene triunguis TaxID=2587831 RepID=A0A674JH37_9SAUR
PPRHRMSQCECAVFIHGPLRGDRRMIRAVVLFGEPVRWETNLQLIIDVLLTAGCPGKPHHQASYPHIPVLACNMDLMWMAEAQSPRDNLMTDIYGANLYNRYLEEKNSRKGSKGRIQAKVAAGTRSATISQDDEIDHTWSVLVCTGVYNPHTEVPSDTRESITETVFHGHRDFRFDPALVEPDHIVPDVDAAVDLIYQLENFAPNQDTRTF